MLLYDYISMKPYVFDFDSWFNQFNDNSAFFQKWYSILSSSYQPITTVQNATYLRYNTNLYNQKMLLHFNIDHISNIPYKRCDIGKIMLNAIGTPDDNLTYLFTPTTENNIFHFLTFKPIILCPIPTDYGLKFVVIDGNHRITVKKLAHIKYINSLIYLPDSEADFATPFEYNMYIFLLELFKKSCQ